MRTQELVAIANTKKMLKPEQLQEALRKELNVKEYISIKDKKNLVDEIINECILFEDGVFKFDEIDKYIHFTMKTIEAYTDLKFSDDIEDDYDQLCMAGLLNMIIGLFQGEYDSVNVLLQMKCDYLLSGNNIEVQFGKFLNEILLNAQSITNALSNKINSIDLSNLSLGDVDLNAIMQLLGKLK